MSKRFYNLFHTLVILASAIGMVLFVSSVSFSVETYPIPQTAEVRLAWDPNDPAPDGYRIYQRAEGESYEYGKPVWKGPENSGTVYNLERDTTYYYVVRAYAGSQESADSEEVSFVARSPEPTTYQISSVAGDHGAISPGGTVVVPKDADHTFSIIPETGYHVVDVKVDGQSKGAISSYTFSQVDTDHTIDASFAVNSYIISAVAGANGNISPVGSTSVDHGASQTFAIAPDEGYRVANVIVDGLTKGAILSYTFEAAAESHTISANFTVDTYQIAASAGINGSISPSGTIRADRGASKSYTISAAIGHHVEDVLVDGMSMGAINMYTFDQIKTNHTIHAVFAADTYTITAMDGANGIITPAGIVDVTSGGSQTYTFAADEGFHVSDIFVDGQSMGASEGYTFQDVTEGHSISVNFLENTFVNIWIEAEDGDLQWPMEIADDENAGAGGCILVPSGTGNLYSPSENAGYAEYHFEVPETGDYAIWGRQVSNDTASDSFFISVDGHAEMVWHTKLGGQDVWTWDVVSKRNPGDPRDPNSPELFRLAAGAHTLKFTQREDGTKLDQVLITNDPTLGFYDLMLSYSPDRSGAVLLDGAAIGGNIYAFVEPLTDIKKVEFFIDGVLHQTENYAPYDLSGSAGSGLAAPFGTGKLSQGSHMFSARITKTDGSSETISANVNVYGSMYEQWVSTSPDRSNPVALDGATVEGNIYAFVAPLTDIKKVEFFIDGVLHQTEKYAPYDLSGSAGSGLAAPFDTGKLSKGSHMFSARITKTSGSIETITVDVSVENLID